MKRYLAAIAAVFLLSTAPSQAAQLSHSKFTIASVISVDTTTHTAIFRLRKGTAEGKTVWFIVTDASNAKLAQMLGVNYAPFLASLGLGAVQKATRNDDATFTFTTAPSFSETRTYVPGKTGFPPDSATPGGKSDNAYSPFVTLADMPGVVLNAPIVATGDGPFDVTTHANTEDRVIAIDATQGTVTLALARGFFNDKAVYYLSTEASDPVASSVERATFVPSLAKASASAEIPIGVVVNGPQTGSSPQGLAFLALRTPLADDATAANAQAIMSSFNVLSLAPDLKKPYAENGYSPLWNVMVVGTPQAKRLTTYAQIAPIAKAAGFVVNCPVVAYGDNSSY